MNSDPREFLESPLSQGYAEQVAYLLTTTPWGSAPSAPAVTLLEVDQTTGVETDVSSSKLVGGASVAGDVITTPLVTNLAQGHLYRMLVRFTVNGNVLETFGLIQAGW